MTELSFFKTLETDAGAANSGAAECTIEYRLTSNGGAQVLSAVNIVGNALKPDGTIEIATDMLLHIRLASGEDWKFDASWPVELSNSAAAGFYRLVSVDADHMGVVIAATRAPDGTNINHSLISHIELGASAGVPQSKTLGNTIGNPPRNQ